jgi:hypothetical protein
MRQRIAPRRREAQRGDGCRLRRHGAYEFCCSKRCSPAASRAWDAPRRELLWKHELGTLLASAMCEAGRSSTQSTQRGSASRFMFPVALLSPIKSHISYLLLLSLAPAHPRLPFRPPFAARKRPARHATGIAHGVAIGVATVTKFFRGRPYVGIVDSFRDPWFHVTFSNGDEEELHGLELARLLSYRAATFYEPDFSNYDFSVPWYSNASTVPPSSAVGALSRRRDGLDPRRRCDSCHRSESLAVWNAADVASILPRVDGFAVWHRSCLIVAELSFFGSATLSAAALMVRRLLLAMRQLMPLA